MGNFAKKLNLGKRVQPTSLLEILIDFAALYKIIAKPLRTNRGDKWYQIVSSLLTIWYTEGSTVV